MDKTIKSTFYREKIKKYLFNLESGYLSKIEGVCQGSKEANEL